MTPRTRFNCRCQACGHVWTNFFMPMPAEALSRFAKVSCPMCFDQKPRIAGADDHPIEVLALSLLSRAIEAMSRTEPNGVSTEEWDAIVAEGTAMVQKAAIEGGLAP